MKILLAGGGSGGPVAPLIAVAQAIKKQQPTAKFLLVGTHKGPERQMAENAGIAFTAIPAGKWRRYFALQNFAAPFLTLAGFFAALKILKRFRPDCIFGAGSFVQVPVIWAGWFLKIPVIIHQQDVSLSLANRLCEPCAKKITVCFEKSLSDFSESFGLFYKHKKEEKITQTGNPFRAELGNVKREQGLKKLNLSTDMPILLVLGGGTGADFVNRLIIKALPELSKIIQIVHSTGLRAARQVAYENYHQFNFIADMASAYAAADIVLSRAGLSTLTELANLGKVSIIIPMPETHQEYNAALLEKFKAALVFEQKDVSAPGLVAVIRRLLFNLPMQKSLAKNISQIMPKNSAGKIAELIIDSAHKYAGK